MKPERGFIAERPLAAHCPELLHRGPDTAALRPLLARVGERLARRLAAALAPLLGGEAPLLRCSELRETDPVTLAGGDPLAAHCLFACGANEAPLLAVIAACGVLRIVDRAFGGRGVAPSPLPEAFPMAAELMIVRIESLLAAQLAAALAAVCEADDALAAPTAIVASRRDARLTNLAPFALAEPLLALSLEIREELGEPWTITLALPERALAALFGIGAQPPRAVPQTPQGEGGLRGCIAEVPLRLAARIVDMRLPFSTIAALAPGQILPVAVARSVPLTLGSRIIAEGVIGDVDDCVALQLTRVF